MAKKKWNVHGAVHASKFIGTFEADTKEEAEAMAWDSEASCVSVCHQCADDIEDPEVVRLITEEVPA